MEVGAFFILVVVLVVVVVGGALVYGVAAHLRRKKLDPERDKLADDPADEHARPRHVRVRNEQRSRFLTNR